MWTYLVLNSVNIKYWDDTCRKNEILAYLVTGLINTMFERVPWPLDLKHDLYLFGFVFDKMKILEWPLSPKWDFSLYGYKFDKYYVWTCPSMSLDAKPDIWTFLVLKMNLYWNDPCREDEILAYMIRSLINGMIELVPWFKAWCEPIWFSIW